MTADDVPVVFRHTHAVIEWRDEWVVLGPPRGGIPRAVIATAMSENAAIERVPDGGIVRRRCVGYTPWQTVATA